MSDRKQHGSDQRPARIRTVERCEAYLDRLSDLIADSGKNWVCYRPLVERLEREAHEARAEIVLHERMLRRKRRDDARELVSPLPLMVHLVCASDPRSLSIAQLWERTGPHNSALSADDKRRLMMYCRNPRIAKAIQGGMALAFK